MWFRLLSGFAQAIEEVDQHKLNAEEQNGANCERYVDFILSFTIVFVPQGVEDEVDAHAREIDRQCDNVDYHHGLGTQLSKSETAPTCPIESDNGP